MKKAILILLLFIPCSVFSRELPQHPKMYSCDWVFSINNNLNSSSVVYALYSSGNKMNGAQPVYNYMHRQRGGNPRELNPFEQSIAYGIKSQTMEGDNTVHLILEKYPNLPITIQQTGSRAKAYVKLNNVEYKLMQIYVKAKEGLFGTSVIYVKLILKDRRTGKETYRMLKQ